MSAPQDHQNGVHYSQEAIEQHIQQKQQRGRSLHPGSNPASRPGSRPNSRPNSRPGSRAGSRPVSWLVQTNSEYANMFENYGGHHANNNHHGNHQNGMSNMEEGRVTSESATPSSRPQSIKAAAAAGPHSYIAPSNEKMTIPGSTRPSVHKGYPDEGTLIKEDIMPDGSSTSASSDELDPAPAPRGTVTPIKASFLLGKAFVGTGVLFLPKAFKNGGLLFSCVTIAVIAAICCIAFLMLVKVRLVIKESFQDIGLILFGKWARYAVLVSVFLSQVGFCCAYLIFVAENIDAVVQTFTECTFHGIQEKYYIFVPLIVLIPLVLIRKMEILSLPSMLANFFIIFGIVYLWYFSIHHMAVEGPGPNIKLFNQNDFALLIGTIVFSFEGIGLVVPITESMAEPEKFPKVLAVTITIVALIFASVGALGYAAFGENIQTIVVLNLPITSGWTITVQILYSLAIILSVPLMLSPASRILEDGAFGDRSGRLSNKVKLQKNTLRIALVCLCAVISFVVGGPNLDKFVSFVGSVACMPLCFIFPAMFHYKACAKTIHAKVLDIILGVFGIIAMAFTLYITVRSWVEVSAPDAALDSCAIFNN
ncbi:neutral amino acid transporter [Mortierella sp. AD032]|nr:neutral amino acid transporter [Mortierella sp. AD032]